MTNELYFEDRSREEVVRSWLEFHRLYEQAGDLGHFTNVGDHEAWSGELLIRAARADPEFCWHVVLQLIDAAETDETIASIAAGPLEDLLAHHGTLYIDALEALSKSQPKVQKAVSGVWQNTTSRDVWLRIQDIQKSVLH